MHLKKVGEKRIIRGLEELFGETAPRVIKAIGDDASITVERGDRVLLATTDILVEGVHFSLEYTPPRLLGRKSLSISLSDIAAMGGEPLFFLVSIALSPDTEKEFLDELYQGIREVGVEHGCALIGGNTSASVKHAMVSTTVLGEADEERVVMRSGARAGDLIFVTGTLGDAALGLEALKGAGGEALLSGPFRKAALRHLDPRPRVAAGRMLAERSLAHSMIDVSDGLLSDLKEIACQSGVGAEVELDAVPLSMELKRYVGEKPDSISLALSGGEDYELLFTAPEEKRVEIGSAGRELELPVTPIGRIVEKERGIRVIDRNGRPVEIKSLGFEHF